MLAARKLIIEAKLFVLLAAVRSHRKSWTLLISGFPLPEARSPTCSPSSLIQAGPTQDRLH
jgi:hypothetical protein